MITVHADVDAVMRGESPEITVEDDNDNIMAYVADAIMAACYMAVYAEAAYGPIAANLIVEGLKGDIVKKALDEARMEERECESEE